MKRKLFKKVVALILAGACVAGGLQLPAVTSEAAGLEDSMTGYWDFENTQGTTVKNKISGGKDGVLSGSNVSIIEGTKFGKSLHFDGGSGEGVMTVASVLNTQSGPFSISMWYKADTAVSGNMMLLQQSGEGRSLLILKSDNTYRTFINGQNVDGSMRGEKGAWQHVIFTYDPSSNVVKIYVNGKKDIEKDAGSNVVNSMTDLLVGRHKNEGNTDPAHMQGDVDEICLFKTALTDAQAAELYEDKAGSVLFDQLTATIDKAQKLYDSGVVPAGNELASALQAAITAAKKLTASSSAEDIQKMMDDLEKAMKAYNNLTSIKLNIDLDDVQRTIDGSIFGINHRYAFNGYGTFDSTTMEMKEDFVNLYKQSGFGSIRYPGGTISNLFQWKGSLGKLEDRTKQIHGFYNNAGQGGIIPAFGISEIATFAQEAGSEIVYVYGFGRGSAQDAADLVEFLNAPVGLNPNGGVDWAKVRALNGHEEPYNVRYFEIGNENQQGGGDGTASQQYWTAYTSGAENAYINGDTATFNKQYAVRKDDWNQAVSASDGTANQTRYMRYANPNPMAGENGTELDNDFKAVNVGSVHIYVNNAEWRIVDSLDTAGAGDEVVAVDYRDGSFTFGDDVHGKIPPANQSITVSYTVDRDGFVDISKAMKETMKKIDPDKDCLIYSSWETQGFVNKMASGGFNDYYDGLTIHPYSGTPAGGSGNPQQFYDSAMSLAESASVPRVKSYVDMLPEGKVPVISEYGIFRSTDTMVRSQTHALYIAKVLMEYVRLGSPYIQKHCLADWYSSGADSLGPTQQAVIQVVPQTGANTGTGEGDYRFFATPSARVFEMLNSNGFGEEIVASAFDRTDKLSNGVSAYSALAGKDSLGNVYVAIVNVDRENSKAMEISVDGMDVDGVPVEVQKLESESITDENTLDDPNKVAVARNTFTNEGDTVSIELKPHSFVVLKIGDEKPVELTGIEIAKLPDKTVYKPDEELDITGMEVMAVYSDGTKTDVTQEVQVSDLPKEEGKHEITVTYEGMTATFEVTVKTEEEKPNPPVDPKPSFNDVTTSDWFYKEVEYVNKNGLMTGLSKTEFGPGQPLARAQFAIILHRMNDEPKVEYTAKFKDVFKGDWYASAILWASSTKVVTGYSNGNFGPSDNINREQMALMMYRYAKYKKHDVSTKADIGKFVDASSVSDFAKDAMEWAFGMGIITGKDNGTRLDPQGNASRAECAAIIKRFVQKSK